MWWHRDTSEVWNKSCGGLRLGVTGWTAFDRNIQRCVTTELLYDHELGSHNPKYYKRKSMPFKENSEMTFLFPVPSFKLSGLKDKCCLLTFKSVIHKCHWISCVTWKCHIIKVKCIRNIHVELNRRLSRLLGLLPSYNSMFTRQEDICTDLFSKDKT